MGFLDDVAGGIMNNSGSGNLTESILGLLTSTEGGGLTGIVKQFNDNGLGEIVSSWVGTGANLPISPEQVTRGLGNQTVQTIARQLGLSDAAASSGLAEILPTVIDKLTPDGTIPSGDLLANGLNFLKGKLF